MKHFTTKSAAVMIIILMVGFLFTDVNAQYQIRTYDLNCNNNPGFDNARSIINSMEGGYAISGYTYAGGCGIGVFDWMFLKLQPSGLPLGARLYGTLADDKCNSILQTKIDSSYLMSGFMADGNNFLKKATFMNVDRSGGLKYARMIDDTVVSQYNQGCIDSAKKNAFAGWKDFYLGNTLKKMEKIIVTRYNISGIMDWGHTYITMNANSVAKSYDEAQSVCFQRTDNSYGVASRTNIFSKQSNVWDIMITRLNGSGGVLWNRTYAFNLPATHFYPNTEPRKIIPMDDGGFVVVGFTNKNVQSENDIIVLRVDAAGNLMWSGCYGNTNFIELGQSIVFDGNTLVLTGSIKRSVTTPDAFIMKIPVTGGAAIWTSIWDRGNNLAEGGYDIVLSNTSGIPGYAVTGDASYNAQDVFLWRTNPNGMITGSSCNDSLYVQYIANEHIVKDVPMKIRKLRDKEFYPAIQNPQVTNIVRCYQTDNYESGESDNNGTGQLQNNENIVKDYALGQNYPNPFNPTTKIMYDLPVSGIVDIKVYNSAGKEVMTLVSGMKSTGRHEVVFNGSSLTSGIYYYRITASGDGKEFTDVKKMMLIK
ncbi:MAG: T9SS type A sorting domain-containing protein [Bacteroidetes bacterium]|nr:T9SS type A sorting domain-containing protein [Bacteroidota bacterium]